MLAQEGFYHPYIFIGCQTNVAWAQCHHLKLIIFGYSWFTRLMLYCFGINVKESLYPELKGKFWCLFCLNLSASTSLGYKVHAILFWDAGIFWRKVLKNRINKMVGVGVGDLCALKWIARQLSCVANLMPPNFCLSPVIFQFFFLKSNRLKRKHNWRQLKWILVWHWIWDS